MHKKQTTIGYEHFWEKLFSSPNVDFFLSILDAIHEGIEMVDKDGWVKYVNPAFTRITGLKPSDRIGLNMCDLVPDGPLDQVIKTCRKVYGEKLCMKDAGIEIICNTAPIYVKDQFMGAIVVFQDVKELNMLNRQLSKSREKIQILNNKLSKLSATNYGFADIIGENPGLIKNIELAKKVSKTESNVLITGESGTGKELFAHSIHRESNRCNNAFIKVNCAAIPENLLESEMFGYDKGAFTGANKQKLGLFELANEGTIFLDEIGDMSLHLQSKLLRVLDDRNFFRIGGTEPVDVDVRIIVATNRKLKGLCEEGKFRQDLFYRINVINIEIPPLRERREDIMVLAEFFLKKHTRLLGKEIFAYDRESKEIIKNYNWPGNVRELHNCIERAILIAGNDILTAADFNFLQTPNDSIALIDAPSSSLQSKEKELIIGALEHFGWSVSGKERAANALKISLRTLYNKIKRYNLKKI